MAPALGGELGDRHIASKALDTLSRHRTHHKLPAIIAK